MVTGTIMRPFLPSELHLPWAFSDGFLGEDKVSSPATVSVPQQFFLLNCFEIQICFEIVFLMLLCVGKLQGTVGGMSFNTFDRIRKHVGCLYMLFRKSRKIKMRK